MPGALTRQMIDDLIRRNVLMTGGWELGGRMIELDKAPGNILNAVAEKDNVVPFAAVAPVMALIGAPDRREQMLLTGGHVTFGAGSHAFKRTVPALSRWISEHSDELDPPRER
jgi:polyhydroxyalkanoate synthase